MHQDKAGQVTLTVSVDEAYKAVPVIPWWFFQTEDVVTFMSETGTWSVFGMKEMNKVFVSYSLMEVITKIVDSEHFSLEDEYFALDNEGALTSLDDETLNDKVIDLFRSHPEVSVSFIKWAYEQGLEENVGNYFRCVSSRLNTHWGVDRVDIIIGDKIIRGRVEE